jgi:hypothetical protein
MDACPRLRLSRDVIHLSATNDIEAVARDISSRLRRCNFDELCVIDEILRNRASRLSSATHA